MDEEDDDLELNRVVDKTFPALAAEEIFAAFRSGAYHDAVWRCSNGGNCYKVHRFVLAMGSPFLRYGIQWTKITCLLAFKVSLLSGYCKCSVGLVAGFFIGTVTTLVHS